MVRVVELVNTLDCGSSAERFEGSSPFMYPSTNYKMGYVPSHYDKKDNYLGIG